MLATDSREGFTEDDFLLWQQYVDNQRYWSWVNVRDYFEKIEQKNLELDEIYREQQDD